MDHKNVHGGQLDPRIIFRNAGVIPFGNLAQVDIRQDIRSDLQIAYTFQVENRHHRAQHRRDVLNLDLGRSQLLVGHGTIAGAKINNARGHLADTAAAANRLIVDLDPGMSRAVFAKPLGINRIGEGRSRSVELLRVSPAHRCNQGSGY